MESGGTVEHMPVSTEAGQAPGATGMRAWAAVAAGSVGTEQLAWGPCAQVHARGRVEHRRVLFFMFPKIIWINFVLYFKDKDSVY